MDAGDAEMTSRQRVLAAFDHREADRVPVDFGGHRSSGMSAMLYPELRRVLGLGRRPVRVYDPVQQLAVIDADVLDRLGADAIELGRGFALHDRDWIDWVLPCGTPCQMPVWAEPRRREGGWVLTSEEGVVLAHMPDGALYFEQTRWPFSKEEDLDRLQEALQEVMWVRFPTPPGPLVAGPEGPRNLADGARRLRGQTDRAIIGLFGGSLFEYGEWLYGMDNYLCMFAGEPRRLDRFLGRLTDLHLADLEGYLKSVGPYIDIIAFGDDLGMQTGPLVSPQMYRRFLKPRHRTLWSRVKELADVRIMLHCCGGIRELLPDLIDAGLEAVNPVQTNSRGMDPQELKWEFGGDIVFWGGGCDTRDVLPAAKPEQVRDHVRRRIDTFSPGGGFVFQQVHNILADVPIDNILAMFEAVRKH
jgi:uroporphyrinogen decarboxylase